MHVQINGWMSSLRGHSPYPRSTFWRQTQSPVRRSKSAVITSRRHSDAIPGYLKFTESFRRRTKEVEEKPSGKKLDNGTQYTWEGSQGPTLVCQSTGELQRPSTVNSSSTRRRSRSQPGRPVKSAAFHRNIIQSQSTEYHQSRERGRPPTSVRRRTHGLTTSSSRPNVSGGGRIANAAVINRQSPDAVKSSVRFADEVEDELDNEMVNMNMMELPPITKRNDAGSTFRSKTSGENTPRVVGNGEIIKYEKPALISVENGITTDVKNGVKQTYRSTSSTTPSSNEQSQYRDANNTFSKDAQNKVFSRSKTWTATVESSNSSNKLDTVFERGVKEQQYDLLDDDDYFTNNNLKLSNGVITDNTRKQENSPEVPKVKPIPERRVSLLSRTQSNTNLSRISDNSSKKKMLSRASSDQNITNGSQAGSYSSRNTGRRRVSVQSASGQRHWVYPRTNNNSAGSRKGGLRQSQSQPNLQNQRQNAQDEESKAQRNRIIDRTYQRIWDWLDDIIDAERPESPIIYYDEPLQTDTAIHVVYDGD